MGIGIILFLPVSVGGEGGREGENILIYKNRFRTIFIHCGIRFSLLVSLVLCVRLLKNGLLRRVIVVGWEGVS